MQLTRPVFCAVILAVVCFSGCIFGGGHDMEARINTEGKKIAVIPFRKQDDDLYFLESKVGDQIAVMVAQIVMRETVDTKLADPKDAFDLIRDRKPESINWGEVAKKLKADYVVIGNIRLYRAKDPKHVNCFKGNITVDVKVWCPDNSMVLMDTVNAQYPTGSFKMPVLNPFETTEDEILGRLRTQAALKIARFFFDYTPAKD